MTKEEKRIKQRIAEKKYYEKNKKKVITKKREYQKKNVEKIKEQRKIYTEENKEMLSKKRKLDYQKNIEREIKYRNENKEYYKIYRENNKTKAKAYSKKYRENNKAKAKAYSKKYREENKEKIKEQRKKNRLNFNKQRRERSKNDILYRLTHTIRSSIQGGIKRGGYIKTSKTTIILGCSFDELKTYLELKFEDWMNWNNYGLYNGCLNFGWDIDHIIPISTAKTEDDIIKLNHYSNLQPLCSYTNRHIKKDNLLTK